MAFSDPAVIIQMLGWDADDSDLVADVTATLEDAEEAVQEYCQTRFEERNATAITFDSPNANTLSLAGYLRALTSVWVLDELGVRSYEFTDVVARPNPPVMRDGSGNPYWTWLQRRNGEQFPLGLQCVEVTGNWGFVTLPRSVVRAIAFTVKHLFDLREVDANKTLESGFGRTIQAQDPDRVREVPPAAQRLLEKYKHHSGFTE